jgi:hypothetical protein
VQVVAAAVVDVLPDVVDVVAEPLACLVLPDDAASVDESPHAASTAVSAAPPMNPRAFRRVKSLSKGSMPHILRGRGK